MRRGPSISPGSTWGGVRIWACGLSLALLGCEGHGPEVWQGYVEGEFVHLAAPQAGYLKELPVARGRRVQAGQVLFVLSADPDGQTLDEARARADSAQERLQNLQDPGRAPEVAAARAAVQAAQAAHQLAQTQWQQQEALFRQHFASPLQLDAARSARDQAAAQEEAARQRWRSVQASVGRQGELGGARSEWQAAQAQVAMRQWLLQHKTGQAPEAGELSDTFYQPGEWVPAGAPVVSLLPDHHRRIRFFVPQAQVAALHPGQWVKVGCDGCPTALKARIDTVASAAEYTPPVIYSKGSRAKLVFRVEALPESVPAGSASVGLPPGLPVDVVPLP